LRNKAWRRKQEVRKKKKVVREYYNWWPDDSGEWDSRTIGMRSHSPKWCSCHMCGNPRKYYNEQTLQERKHEKI